MEKCHERLVDGQFYMKECPCPYSTITTTTMRAGA